VVREAAKRLELQGLLEIRHGLGIRAVECLHKPIASSVELQVPDPAERLRQLIEVRLMIEPANARAAAERAGQAQIDAVRAAHQELVEAVDAEAAVSADLNFHAAVAEASGNRISLLLVATLSELLRASVARSHRRATPATAIKQHGQILAAIARRDPAGAGRAMEKHLLAARTDLGLEGEGKNQMTNDK
jgi:GntR family transcriptional repressor for pyruvate dehydrogenase complex